jgi:membrane peptidoglycan carboxypeptidase
MEQVAELAQNMGIQQRLKPFPALALGAMEVTPMEMAAVYGTLASGGERPTLHGLSAVYDLQGKPIAGQAVPPPQRVLSEGVAFLITDVLQDVLDHGTGRGARSQGLEGPLAGKTGTTNDRRDSWFAGYSPRRATLVWVGYDDNSKTRLSGARAALPIWARYTHAVRPNGGYRPFTPPEDVVQVLIDPASGELATTRCPQVIEEYFLASNPPSALCSQHGTWRAHPLGREPEIDKKKGNRLKRWLHRIRGKKNGQRGDAT